MVTNKPVDNPRVAPVALRLAIGKYVSQRETSYLSPKRFKIRVQVLWGTGGFSWIGSIRAHRYAPNATGAGGVYEA
jgi:hypothetical protein